MQVPTIVHTQSGNHRERKQGTFSYRRYRRRPHPTQPHYRQAGSWSVEDGAGDGRWTSRTWTRGGDEGHEGHEGKVPKGGVPLSHSIIDPCSPPPTFRTLEAVGVRRRVLKSEKTPTLPRPLRFPPTSPENPQLHSSRESSRTRKP